VPKTTTQLKALRERRGLKLHTIELDVAKMVHSTAEMDAAIDRAVVEATEEIKKGEDVLVMTSRKLLVGKDALSSLRIGSVVADALVRVVQNINIRPRYIIAKVLFPLPSPYSLPPHCRFMVVFQQQADIAIIGRHHLFLRRDQGPEYEASHGHRPSRPRSTALAL
jgi:hypothetical protein